MVASSLGGDVGRTFRAEIVPPSSCIIVIYSERTKGTFAEDVHLTYGQRIDDQVQNAGAEVNVREHGGGRRTCRAICPSRLAPKVRNPICQQQEPH